MCEAVPHYRPSDACAQIVGSEEVLTGLQDEEAADS
jgi:hypothetical protein